MLDLATLCAILILGRNGSHRSVQTQSALPAASAGLTRPKGSMSGVVRDTDGNPLAGAAVTLDRSDDPNQHFGTRTDKQGRFVFDGLSASSNSYYIWFKKPGFHDESFNNLHLDSGEHLVLPIETLDRFGRPVSGRVLDARGRPVPKLEIGAQGSDLDHDPTTDRNGRFELKGLTRGRHWLIVMRPNHEHPWLEKALAYREVGDGDTGVVIRITPGELHDPAISNAKILGNHAPELRAATWLQGGPVSLTGLKGRLVVLDFWGVHCLVCIDAMPFVEQLHRRFAAQGVAFVGICDPLDGRRFGPGIVKKTGVTYPNMLDRTDRRGDPVTHIRYGYKGLPHLILIGRDGRVLVDTYDYNDIRSKLESILPPTQTGRNRSCHAALLADSRGRTA